MSLPDLLSSSSPSLSEQLRRRTNELRSKIVRDNYITQFAQAAPELAEFRHATAGLLDEMDDDALLESFQKTIPLTTHAAYSPFVERFSEKPCNASAVIDLLAPGLPDYLVESSSTSGGRPKLLPKYKSTSRIQSSDTGSWVISDPLRRRTKAYIWSLIIEPVDVVGEDDTLVKTLYVTRGSIVGQRTRRFFDPENDEEKMGTCILDHAAPFAATFILALRPFLLIHALFALASRSLEAMDMLFINTFVDLMRNLDMEYDMVVDCIASGTIPDLEGIAEVRHYLEMNISPDPERAEELRRLGSPCSQPGWCARAWPNLRSVTATASGAFAASVPMARWFLGPETNLLSHGYGSTEAYIGPPYNPTELDTYKPGDDIVFEFLDVNKEDSISSLSQAWEVELGTRYELVLTTEDGLWRYRLGDVIEISGFDPRDGVPIIRFLERRNMVLRLPIVTVTEQELQTTVSSMLINTVNWTVTIDDRSFSNTIGFFVELSDGQDTDLSDLALAPQRALDHLLRLHSNTVGILRKPTIWLVRPGTFCDFLQLKLDEGSRNSAQIKIPVVLPKDKYVKWFLGRVVQEL